MRIPLFFAVVLFLVSNTFAQEVDYTELTGLELYIWLEREGMREPSITNDVIHDLVLQGLQHDDTEIVDCTISAIGLHASQKRFAILENRTQPSLDRKLEDVPQVYKLLMDMWNKGWSEAGEVLPPPEPIDELAYLDRVMFKTGCLAKSPTWALLPLVFATLFPGDEKVREIIWKTLPDDEDPGPLLAALYVGEFNQPEDQAFRIEVLTNPDAQWYKAKVAADSLGKFQSDVGFDALITTLQRDRSKFGLPYLEIVGSILAYGDKATPHLKLLSEKMASVITFNSDERQRAKRLKEEIANHLNEENAEPEQSSR